MPPPAAGVILGPHHRPLGAAGLEGHAVYHAFTQRIGKLASTDS
jgi:hypothetical protein